MINKPRYIVIHHSLTKDDERKSWDAIRNYHIETLGYEDVGYHYGIERIGKTLAIHVGRMEWKPGAHCKHAKMNHRSIGICMVGNHDEVAPTEEQFSLLAYLCDRIMFDYNIPVERVIGHREAGMMDGYDWGKGQFKSCPGAMFDMDEFRKYLQNKREKPQCGSCSGCL